MPTSMKEIATEVAERSGVSVAEMKSRTRTIRITLARQEAYSLMRIAGKSVTQIGQFFGRDHSTISDGCRMFAVREERAI